MGILGDIDARLRDNDNYENALLYFDAEGKLTIAITEKTPLDVLMDIVAFAEHYEGKENIPQKIKRSILRRARLAALEYLTERLITKDPRMHRIGMECLRLRHFREILKSVPGGAW